MVDAAGQDDAGGVVGGGGSGGGSHRLVDLGREDELITWNEWFARTSAVMSKAAESVAEIEGDPVFRVTLRDRRQMLVTHVFTQVSKGKCYLSAERFAVAEGGGPEPVCDVITGYLLTGRDAVGLPVTLGVPPTSIASVECVLTRESRPFGFAAGRPSVEEVEDRGPGLFEVVDRGGDAGSSASASES